MALRALVGATDVLIDDARDGAHGDLAQKPVTGCVNGGRDDGGCQTARLNAPAVKRACFDLLDDHFDAIGEFYAAGCGGGIAFATGAEEAKGGGEVAAAEGEAGGDDDGDSSGGDGDVTRRSSMRIAR